MNANEITNANENTADAIKNGWKLLHKSVQYITIDGQVATATVSAVAGETAALSDGNWCYVWQMVENK